MTSKALETIHQVSEIARRLEQLVEAARWRLDALSASSDIPGDEARRATHQIAAIHDHAVAMTQGVPQPLATGVDLNQMELEGTLRRAEDLLVTLEPVTRFMEVLANLGRFASAVAGGTPDAIMEAARGLETQVTGLEDRQGWTRSAPLIERGAAAVAMTQGLAPAPQIEAAAIADLQVPEAGPPPAPAPGQDFPGADGPRGRRQLPPRVVNTGFAPEATPDDLLAPTTPLAVDGAYYFWIDIGKPIAESGELTPTDIPAVPVETRLRVVLFGFRDGLRILPGADQGQFFLQADGQVRAWSQPLGERPPASRTLATRLFFPVRTPPAPGRYALRCNLYLGQVLLQSRLVEADVYAPAATAGGPGPFWWSTLDYTLTNQLDPAQLEQIEANPEEPHRLSVLQNANDDGSHSFHFLGDDGTETIKNDDVRFDGGELSGLIKQARDALRRVSWGKTEDWQEGDPYRYGDGQLDPARLTDDLIRLAKWGREFHVQVGSRLGAMQVRRLGALLRAPGTIQIAMKESPSFILPAGLIYDHPLDTGADGLGLCPAFMATLTAGSPLEDSLCFKGHCPSYSNNTLVCPSGFWGFRHALGMPLSVRLAPAVPPTIDYDGTLQLTMGESTDMQLLDEHQAELARLKTGVLQIQACTSRADIFTAMQASPHLVYFYCHGGLKNDAPFLQIGPGQDPEQILPSNLVEYIAWENPRPLVFLNGCHTTAVDPMKALQFIRPLVEECQCAGVIGTEITIFEGLATDFAEEFYRRLLAGETVGQSLRGARLKVLSLGNPLGLVYIPFVLSTIRLRDRSAATTLGLTLRSGPGEVIERDEHEVRIGGVRIPINAERAVQPQMDANERE